ncbi:hypothetical protein C0992_009784 [Termitomyces sp. T32_za158]|nr:hypothetical protein C0992_009784 [Termitomyces sp. T32_za158]
MAEQTEIFNQYKASGVSHNLPCDPLGGIFDHSSNHSVQEVAVQEQSGCVGSPAISLTPSATMSNLVVADSSSVTSDCDHGNSVEIPVQVHSSVPTQAQSLPSLVSREPSFAPPASVDSSDSAVKYSENEHEPVSVAPSSELGARSSQLPTAAMEDGHQILFYVKALYDYTASIDEEFDFKEGDVIAVTHTSEDGWWNGELLDESRRQRGRHVFPSNFVFLYEKQDSEAPTCS